ncbi:MAG: SoxR reducing system RseC family protein [Colwellia sp.]
MMEEQATVAAINQKDITLVSNVKSSCSSCSQSENCASGQVAKAFPHKKLEFSIAYSSTKHNNLSVGDQVIVALPQGDVLKSAWQVYCFPLIGLIGFSAISQFAQGIGIFNNMLNGLLNHELFALSIGITGGYLGHRLAKSLQNRNEVTLKLCPKIIRTVSV